MTRRLPLFFLFIIILFGKITAQCPVILTDDPIEVCGSGGTSANIETTGTILSANWSPAIGMDNPFILNPTFITPIDTTYILTIIGLDADTKDTCEVQKLIDIKVTVFELKITQDTVALPCGDTIRLSAEVIPNGSFFIIDWETADGHFTQGNQSLTPLVDEIGQYNVNVIGTLGRIVCKDKDSLQVVLQNDDLSISPPEKLHCNQSTIRLTVADQLDTTAYLYNWATTEGQFVENQNQLSVLINRPGIYEISRTNLFGDCKTTATTEVEEVAPFEDFSIKLNEQDCEAVGKLFITNIEGGQAPYHYSIDNGITFQDSSNFEGLTALSYGVLVKDGNGCEVSKSVNFTPSSNFNLSLIPFQEVEKGTTFQIPLEIADNGASIESIQWWPNVGLSCTDCPDPFLTEYKNRRYEVTVIDDKGCEQQAKIEIAIRLPNLYYGPTVFSPNDDGQNDEFTIFLNTKFVKQVKNMTIFDRYGNLIFQQSALASSTEVVIWDGRFKGKAMPVGAYLYAGELELLDGETERFSGTLNLIR